MKVIQKALEEDLAMPQPRWWGRVEHGLRYIMRYGHTMLVFRISDGEIPWEYPMDRRTITDKRGINSAKKLINEKYGNN